MNLRRVAALIGKEFREFWRDRLMVAIAALMPLVLLFLFGYAVTLDVKGVALGVYDEDQTPASRELIDRFTATEYFRLRQSFNALPDVEQALQRSRVRVVVLIPPQFQKHLVRHEPAPVQILVDGTYTSSASLATAYAEAIVAAYPRPTKESLKVETRVWYNPALRSANFVVPGLFAVILMAFPPLLTALAIVREKETGTIQQIYASPVTSTEFVAAKLIPYGTIALMEMLILVVTGTLWFEIPFSGNPVLLLAAALIYVLTTVAVGLFVSAVTSTQLTAMLLALIVSLMPSFLYSGFLFPVFTMPYAFRLYSALVPAGYFLEVSRGIVLKGAGITSVWPNLALLMLYALTLFGFAARRIRQKVVP